MPDKRNADYIKSILPDSKVEYEGLNGPADWYKVRINGMRSYEKLCNEHRFKSKMAREYPTSFALDDEFEASLAVRGVITSDKEGNLVLQ